MDYCVKTISYTGYYSLAVHHTTTATYIILCFWSENVLHRVCIGGAPRGILLPRNIFSLIASFLGLFETVPTCVALIGFDDKLNEYLFSSLPGVRPPSVVNSYGPTEFERRLITPTVPIIKRHDFRTILDFLLMKLRTALDRDWLQNLVLLHKVVQVTAAYLDHTRFFFFLVCSPIRINPSQGFQPHRNRVQ